MPRVVLPVQALGTAQLLAIPPSTDPDCVRLPDPIALLMVRSGHNSQTPLPAAQTAGKRFKVQHCKLPAKPSKLVSLSWRVQSPFALVPDFARKSVSLPSGRKVPTNGAMPLVIGVAASSSKAVRDAMAQLVP